MKYYLIAVALLLFFYLSWAGPVHATLELDTVEKLDTNYNSILDYEESTYCAKEDPGNFACLESKPVVKYLYISDRTVKFSEDEDFFAITKNTREFVGPDGQRTVRVFGSDAFIEVEGTWYETDYGFAEPTIWEATEAKSLSRSVRFDDWNPFKIYRVSAQEDPIYAGSGDGDLGCDDNTFATASNMANAETMDLTDNDGNCYVDNATPKTIRNLIFTFDTSSLDGTVDSASLFLTSPQVNALCTDTGVEFTLLESTATSTTATYSSSYQPAATTILTPYVSCSTLLALNANQNYEFVLNSDGESVVDLSGVTPLMVTTDNFINDTAPANGSYIDFYYSEESGTTYDPYLEITLEEEEPPEEEATTTIGLLYPENMCINNDLSIICGMTQHYESTTTEPDWVEYHYYHIPFFIWLIIASVSLWIGNRILIELLIRWRS